MLESNLNKKNTIQLKFQVTYRTSDVEAFARFTNQKAAESFLKKQRKEGLFTNLKLYEIVGERLKEIKK